MFTRFIYFFSVFFSFFFLFARCSSDTSTETKSEREKINGIKETILATEEVAAGEDYEDGDVFKPTPFILSHIADAHDFHIWGEGHHAVSLPLPVILWTKKGLVWFLSSEFHHDNHGIVAVKTKGMVFLKRHHKIYYASDNGNIEYNFRLDPSRVYIFKEDGTKYFRTVDGTEYQQCGQEIDLKHFHPNNAEPIDLSITKNVFSMLLSSLILMLVFISIGRAYRKNGVYSAPMGLQSMLEPIILFVRDDIAIQNIGHKKYHRFMPFLLTIFFFILINNILGLIPIFPGSANVTGSISFTFTLAFIVFLVTTFSGNKNYWGHIFAMPGVPWFVLPVMIPVELIGIVTKPFALMIRLFANITAGHIIILSLVSLIFTFKSFAVAPASVFFVLFMNVLELLVAFLQAYIFTLLTALFVGSAVQEAH